MFVFGLLGCIIVFAVHAPDRWLEAVASTVLVFGATIGYFMNRWSSSRFWLVIAAAFPVHLGLTWVVFDVLLRSYSDIPWIACWPFIFFESGILYYLIRRTGEQCLLRTDERN
jgi:hypothetical protein